MERNVSRQIQVKSQKDSKSCTFGWQFVFLKSCVLPVQNTDTIPTRNPALEAVVYFIPGTRKANTPNRSSREYFHIKSAQVHQFHFGKKTSATVINAMQKRSAIIENGGIQSTRFHHQIGTSPCHGNVAIRIISVLHSPFFIVVLAVADFVIVFYVPQT